MLMIFAVAVRISTHALREEGDLPQHRDHQGLADFYPRPPRGGRRQAQGSEPGRKKISTHALREEGDLRSRRKRHEYIYFYPRPPRGGRRCGTLHAVDLQAISTHALREEGDAVETCRDDGQ